MKRQQIIQSLEPINAIADWPHKEREDGLRNAAVLIPLIERKEWQVLFTKRTEHLSHHPGQVSFPGGCADTVDVSPLHTALRETEEEIGVENRLIEAAGVIEPFLTITGFKVIPIVGFVDPAFQLRIDTIEVSEVFEMPLSVLMDKSLYQQKEIFWKGENRFYLDLKYNEFQIWGATAAMSYAFACRLNSSINSLNDAALT